MRMFLCGAVLVSVAFCCGCGSVVKSVKYGTPDLTAQRLANIHYYLPKGKVVVAGTWNDKSLSWDVTVTSIIETDPAEHYIAYRNAHALFDDDVTIAADQSTGLLQTVSGISTDRSVDALSGLVSTAASALTFGTGIGFGPTVRGTEKMMEVDGPPTEVKNKALSSGFQVTLEGTAEARTADACLVVSCPGSPDPDNKVLYAKFTISLALALVEDVPEPSADLDHCVDGIVVRRPVPYVVTASATVYKVTAYDPATAAKPKPTTKWMSIPLQATFPRTVMLPDAGHKYLVQVLRQPLLSTTTRITLANGMVQSQQQVRPSIVMGILAVPKNLLLALAPIPLQVRNDQQNIVVAADKTLTAEADIKKLQTK